MTTRIHIVLDEHEKERFRAQARREGKSLSEWLREAGRERVARVKTTRRLDTLEDLRAFFAECDARQEGRGKEPDWEEHERVIEASIRSGFAGADKA